MHFAVQKEEDFLFRVIKLHAKMHLLKKGTP